MNTARGREGEEFSEKKDQKVWRRKENSPIPPLQKLDAAASALHSQSTGSLRPSQWCGWHGSKPRATRRFPSWPRERPPLGRHPGELIGPGSEAHATVQGGWGAGVYSDPDSPY